MKFAPDVHGCSKLLETALKNTRFRIVFSGYPCIYVLGSAKWSKYRNKYVMPQTNILLDFMHHKCQNFVYPVCISHKHFKVLLRKVKAFSRKPNVIHY